MRVGAQGQGTVEVGAAAYRAGLLLTYGLFWCVLVEPVNPRHDWFLENLLTVGLATGLSDHLSPVLLFLSSYCLLRRSWCCMRLAPHYTYVLEVPFGFWLKDVLALSRNPLRPARSFCLWSPAGVSRCEVLVRLAGLQGGPTSRRSAGFWPRVDSLRSWKRWWPCGRQSGVGQHVSGERKATNGMRRRTLAAAFASAALTMMVTAWVGTDRTVDAA